MFHVEHSHPKIALYILSSYLLDSKRQVISGPPAERHWAELSQSPIRRAGLGRPPRPSIWRLHWPLRTSWSCSWIATPKPTLPLVSASPKTILDLPSTTLFSP